MPERIVTLKIAKCGECPHSYQGGNMASTLEERLTQPVVLFCAKARGTRDIDDPTTIPTWCPLLDKEQTK